MRYVISLVLLFGLVGCNQIKVEAMDAAPTAEAVPARPDPPLVALSTATSTQTP